MFHTYHNYPVDVNTPRRQWVYCANRATSANTHPIGGSKKEVEMIPKAILDALQSLEELGAVRDTSHYIVLMEAVQAEVENRIENAYQLWMLERREQATYGL